MAKLASITFIGASGTKYKFNVYSWDTNFDEVAAVYFITKRIQESDGGYTHARIYVGQTNDLSKRFDDHHKASCFKRHGANCICIYREDDETERLRIESDLISQYSPRCND